MPVWPVLCWLLLTEFCLLYIRLMAAAETSAVAMLLIILLTSRVGGCDITGTDILSAAETAGRFMNKSHCTASILNLLIILQYLLEELEREHSCGPAGG